MQNTQDFSQFMGANNAPQKQGFTLPVEPKTLVILGAVLILGFLFFQNSNVEEPPLKGSITPEAVLEQAEAEKDALEKEQKKLEIEAQKLELEKQMKDLEIQEINLEDGEEGKVQGEV